MLECVLKSDLGEEWYKREHPPWEYIPSNSNTQIYDIGSMQDLKLLLAKIESKFPTLLELH